MQASLFEIGAETKQSLIDVRNNLQQTVPQLDRFAGDVRSKLLSLVNNALSELQAAQSDLVKLVSESSTGIYDCYEQKLDRRHATENETPSSATSRCPTEQIRISQDESTLLKDTIRRVCNRLDEVYHNNKRSQCSDSKCDLDHVALLINRGDTKDALKMIVTNSRDINDVLKLSAEALDRAGGVNPKVTERLTTIDYVAMCTKYACQQNKSVVDFVDNVLYEALLDGKVDRTDFISDQDKLQQQLDTELEDDRRTVNENAKRFLKLLSTTLIPVTSVALKVTAVVALAVFCVTPLTAGLLCASALALDTLKQFMETRMVLDMFEAFLCATATGERINEVLSNKYVRMASDALLNETVIGTINICHNLSRGSLFKK